MNVVGVLFEGEWHENRTVIAGVGNHDCWPSVSGCKLVSEGVCGVVFLPWWIKGFYRIVVVDDQASAASAQVCALRA